ncbi:histidine kinase [Streptomyces ipomoeae]|uniref:sensor histidine kinase n=1 Tax=Streptomyces ipomoeae TaxID=103232 RepID=UPI001146FA99|nr:histidine kinase [Streptomyces ipomoeae]MDX2695629.1 histidine kinase [Streptomyces ipomoeae]MDX2824749.1 histidine kinase [Streptomyces ipomoeae]MDX2838841.1 histidine kinase [Streptomyces ipomoeae]MDX2875682.1 histidine kinase [Streptomyces ipomoeae]TQE37698.1 sensor histidine kinase [Streptomyces ipomoeae]
MGKTVRQAARATLQLIIAAAMAFGMYLFITVLLITAIATAAVVGAWMLPETVMLIRRIAGAKRHQVAAWTGREIPEAYEPIEGTVRERLRIAVRDPGTHTDARWMLAYYVYGWLPCLMVPLWPLGLVVDGVWCGLLRRDAVVLPLINRLADLEAHWSEALLKPSPKARLAERVQELTATRADAIAAHGAELRRIERDLHDGAQARLVSLSMRIGLAQRAYDRDPEAARKLLIDAQEQAEAALTELRHVVRGIHPPILTDRGLAGAVRALTAGSGLDTTVSVDGLEDIDGPRPPAAVEAAAYFVVAEALTNAARHSGCDHAEVHLTRVPRGVRVVVRDDGRGGAEDGSAVPGTAPTSTGGSGLLGMRRRVAALDGTFAVTSPAGGPTVIDVQLPCVW